MWVKACCVGCKLLNYHNIIIVVQHTHHWTHNSTIKKTYNWLVGQKQKNFERQWPTVSLSGEKPHWHKKPSWGKIVSREKPKIKNQPLDTPHIQHSTVKCSSHCFSTSASGKAEEKRQQCSTHGEGGRERIDLLQCACHLDWQILLNTYLKYPQNHVLPMHYCACSIHMHTSTCFIYNIREHIFHLIPPSNNRKVYQ